MEQILLDNGKKIYDDGWIDDIIIDILDADGEIIHRADRDTAYDIGEKDDIESAMRHAGYDGVKAENMYFARYTIYESGKLLGTLTKKISKNMRKEASKNLDVILAQLPEDGTHECRSDKYTYVFQKYKSNDGMDCVMVIIKEHNGKPIGRTKYDLSLADTYFDKDDMDREFENRAEWAGITFLNDDNEVCREDNIILM